MPSRVTLSPTSGGRLERSSRYHRDDGQHLSDRVALADAKVEDSLAAGYQQMAEGEDVCVGEITHMDVVADCGSVIGREIVAMKPLPAGICARISKYP